MCDVRWNSSSPDETESRLVDSAGTAMSRAVVAAFDFAFDCESVRYGRRGVGTLLLVQLLLGDGASRSGAQQKVSRFHSRHERFSSRLPCSMACDVFENKDHCTRR